MLVKKRNDFSSIEMYEMVEKTNQELEVRYDSQQVYSILRRFLRIQYSPKLKRMSEGINEMIAADTTYMNDLMRIPYLVI